MGEGGYRQINKTLNACAFEDYLSTQQKCLPKLENVEQLSPRVIRILGQNAGKVRTAEIISKMKACSGSQKYKPLTVSPVHTSRDKHLHRRYRLKETYHRHGSRDPSMGRNTVFHPHQLLHRLITRVPNSLARRSHRRGTRPSSPLPLSIHLDTQERA